jgi:hypothetical protein
MKPQIKISIAPAPLEQVLIAEFEAEQRKLLAMYNAAPELLDALKAMCEYDTGTPDDVLAIARAAIAKAEGK